MKTFGFYQKYKTILLIRLFILEDEPKIITLLYKVKYFNNDSVFN